MGWSLAMKIGPSPPSDVAMTRPTPPPIKAPIKIPMSAWFIADPLCFGDVCANAGGASSRLKFGVGVRDARPIDDRHEGIDIGGGSRAIIDVVGMLVHVEREDRLPAGQRRRVVHRPLTDKPAIARRPGHQHPARSTALRPTHRGKLGTPAIDAAEIAHER